MKIEITMYGKTCTHLTEYDDMDLNEVLEHIDGLLRLAGYHFDGTVGLVYDDEQE